MLSQHVRRILRVLGLSCVIVTLSSCGKSGPELYPATGTVSYDGAAPEGASVMLLPSEGSFKPTGLVQADGTFKLSTYFAPDDIREGAPAGQYVVAITWMGEPAEGEGRGGMDAKNKLPAMYNDPATSPFKAEIKAGPNTLGPYEMKKTKGKSK